MRVRYRNCLEREELVTSTDFVEIRFVFPFSARTLPAGSRLRVIVHSPSSLALCRHFNSERPVADQSAADARTAHIRLLHEAEHPTGLRCRFPVLEAPPPVEDAFRGASGSSPVK